MVKEEWRVRTLQGDFSKIAKQFSIDPVTARVLVNRGLKTDADFERFLKGTGKDLHDPFLLKDMERAIDLLIGYFREDAHIRIIGDYDIDGVTSSFILRQGFLEYAAQTFSRSEISVAIPHRMRDGYGLNDRLVEEALKDGVSVIVTCDNGISAAGQVAFAREHGMHVIVTDHHEVPFETEEGGEKRFLLPPAEAVVDPKRADDTYPFKEICGAMVAYKLILGLMRKSGHRLSKEAANDLYAFAAFGTVGDVMPLTDENHVLVKYGLSAVEHCYNPGLRALIEACGLSGKPISAYHIGFVLGPCFNAAGRLESAEEVMKLLCAENETEAMILAEKLRALNEERKLMTEKGVEEAVALIEAKGKIPGVPVVFLPDVHESLAGIIAGRLRERYYRPVFVVTRGEDGMKGSGRSIDEYHMFEEMNRVSRHFKKFGGHKLAAGFTLADEDVDGLFCALNENCPFDPETLTHKIFIDVPMPVEYASLKLAEELASLSPFGTGNPAPLFAHRNIRVENGQTVGKNKNAYKMRLVTEKGIAVDAIFFGDAQAFRETVLKKGGCCDIIYSIEINEFRQRRSLQAVVKHFR